MKKKMNLASMVFLFLSVVGFDHFYRSVMSDQPAHKTDIKDSVKLHDIEVKKSKIHITQLVHGHLQNGTNALN